MRQGKMTPAAAQEFFSSILIGLQMHGQHESSQPLILALGVQAYDILVGDRVELALVVSKILGRQN